MAVPPPALLSTPYTIVFFSVIGLRVAAALPGDNRASWLFTAIGVPPATGRAGLRRIMLAFGVLPPIIIFAAVLWFRWGAEWAATQIICLAVSLLLVEFVLRRYIGVPCSGAWHPERANLRKRWPAYLTGFAFITQAAPRSAYWLVGDTAAVSSVLVILLGAALALRLRGAPTEADLDSQDDGAAVLDLSS
jgi:hypothetical protein